MSDKPDNVEVNHIRKTTITANIKSVYDLIEFADWLAAQNLPGDTVVQFRGYYELNITVDTVDVGSQLAFDELHSDVDYYVSDYNWPEKDRRRRDREWRGPNYGM